MPEVAAVYPVAGAAAFGSQSGAGGFNAGGVLVQFKVGLLLGKFRALDGAAPQGRVPSTVPVANPPLQGDDMTPPPPPPPQ
jgi:hypothetical protein